MEQSNGLENKKRLTFKLFNRERDVKILKFIAMLIFVLSTILVDLVAVQIWLTPTPAEEENVVNDALVDDRICNVAGIELHGDLKTYIPEASSGSEANEPSADQTASENIVSGIRQAENDDSIKATLLEVDSYGGSPVAGQEVANALLRAKKPTVVLIRNAGASAAYLAASGADQIFASKYSDVGGIGVTMSYLDNVALNQKEGLTYISLSAGKFKDTGTPDKPLSQEEKDLLMRDVNIIHQDFIKTVAENRKLDIGKVKKLADGSTMLGEMALQNGLIDQVGGEFEAEEYLKGKIGEGVSVCW